VPAGVLLEKCLKSGDLVELALVCLHGETNQVDRGLSQINVVDNRCDESWSSLGDGRSGFQKTREVGVNGRSDTPIAVKRYNPRDECLAAERRRIVAHGVR
jgi:hypothetical protein